MNNTGTLSGAVGGSESQFTTLTNTGLISGTSYGVVLEDGGLLTNGGTISGSLAAVRASGYTTLVVEPDAAFVGKLFMDGLIVLGGSQHQGGTFALDDPNALVSGWIERISFAADAQWTLEGTPQQVAHEWLGPEMQGFSVGDQIVIDSLAVDASSFVAGQGLVLQSGTDTYLLRLPELPGAIESVTGGNGNLTISATQATHMINSISTLSTQSVVLGANEWASEFYISSTGAVHGGEFGIAALGYAITTSITNSGTILGSQYGVLMEPQHGLSGSISNGYSTLINSGVIYGATGAGADAAKGANVINRVTGTIGSARYGLRALYGASVTNWGKLQGSQAGAYVGDGASLLNLAGGVITGGYGVKTYGGATLVNAGTIAGSRYAVVAQYGLNLEIDPGAVFIGIVDAGCDGTLSLSGTGGLFNASNFVNFSTVWLSSCGTWTLEEASSAITQPLDVGGFNARDSLVVDGVSLVSGGLSTNDGQTTLTLLTQDGAYAGSIAFERFSAADTLVVSSDGINTTIAAAAAILGTSSLCTSMETTGLTLGVGEFATSLSVSPEGGVMTNSGVAVYADYISGASLGNAGLLEAITGGEAVLMRGAASLTNTGTIVGQSGVAAYGGAVITNTGTIETNGSTTMLSTPARVLLPQVGLASGGLAGIGVKLTGSRLENSGTIVGASTGVRGVADGVIANFAGGLISGALTGLSLGNGTLNNAGAIYGGQHGIEFYHQAMITNAASGTISAGPGYSAIFGSGDVTIINAGTILGGVEVSGSLSLIVEESAAFTGKVIDDNGEGALILDGAGSLDISQGFTGFSRISFSSDGFTLKGDTSQLAAGQTISGFGAGDRILLNGFIAASSSFASGTGIILTNAGGSRLTLDVAGSLEGLTTTTTADGTQLVAPCFLAGTRISTARGRRRIETLRIGDKVTAQGGEMLRIKWIGMRSYDGRFAAKYHLMRPVRIAKGAIADRVPVRDLYVSPDHAICLGGHLIHAWRLVNGVSITQPEPPESVTYFHIELERHAVIFAEDCPAESFLDEDCRNRFQNAAEFELLYPEKPVAQVSCLPRLADGFGLHAIWEHLAERAGVAIGFTCGPLRGCLDEIGGAVLRGWAQDVLAPEVPVALLVLAGGEVIGRLLANGYRPDLRDAGLGSGCHGFRMILPAGEGREIEVRRALNGAKLTANDV